MSEDAGAKLLAAVEALSAEIRFLREDLSRDGAAREELESLRARSRERAKKSRDKGRVSRDGNVTESRHGNVTPHVVKALSFVVDLDQVQEKKELKIATSRDGNVTDEAKGLRQQTWAAYSEAYLKRYGAEPLRNAKVNGQVKQLVERLGAEAPEVAAYFVNHPGAWYATKGHAIGLLVAEAEKVRTEWATGRQITATEARQQERTAANFSGWAKHLKGDKDAVG